MVGTKSTVTALEDDGKAGVLPGVVDAVLGTKVDSEMTDPDVAVFAAPVSVVADAAPVVAVAVASVQEAVPGKMAQIEKVLGKTVVVQNGVQAVAVADFPEVIVLSVAALVEEFLVVVAEIILNRRVLAWLVDPDK